MPIRKCDGCLKEYSCRQSLFVHKKKCKGRDLHREIHNPKLYEFIRWCDRNLKDHGHVTLKESKQKGCV